MSYTATLRAMIEQREHELAALREALARIEAAREQAAHAERGAAMVDAWAPRDVGPALYGEDGRGADAEARTAEPAEPAAPVRKLTKAQARFLDALRKLGPHASNDDLAREMGCVTGNAAYLAKKLDDLGVITRAGSGGRGRDRTLLIVGESDSVPTPAAEPVSAPQKLRSDSTPKDAPKRRFTEHAAPDPERVHGLAADHPAVVEGRTLFPTTVVDPSSASRVLVSGANQRKLGDRVTKGPWAGMPIYALTLEERATCPASCHHWSTCYGNGMQLARRNRAGPDLERLLDTELRILSMQHPDGFVVRLHVLGDFYSTDYVDLWAGWLTEFPQLRVFGYTAWPGTTVIGGAIIKLRARMWDRFAIRTSVPADAILAKDQMIHGDPLATTIKRVAEGKQPEGIVCPAQTHPGVCCGSCGLCWSEAARETPIVFMVHGPKSSAPMEPKARKDIKVLSRAPAPPMSTPKPPKPAAERPKPAPAMSAPVAAKPAAPEPAPAQPAVPKKGPNRAPILYAPTKSDAQKRAEEQAAIARFLAEKGARRFDDRAGLFEMLERAFAEEGIEIEQVYGPKARGMPYRLAGKLVTAEHAIKRADVIRKRMGLAPIAAEAEESAA